MDGAKCKHKNLSSLSVLTVLTVDSWLLKLKLTVIDLWLILSLAALPVKQGKHFFQLSTIDSLQTLIYHIYVYIVIYLPYLLTFFNQLDTCLKFSQVLLNKMQLYYKMQKQKRSERIKLKLIWFLSDSSGFAAQPTDLRASCLLFFVRLEAFFLELFGIDPSVTTA